MAPRKGAGWSGIALTASNRLKWRLERLREMEWGCATARHGINCELD